MASFFEAIKARFANVNLRTVASIMMLGFVALDVSAGSGTAFQDVWDNEISAWLDGEPAMIIAALTLLAALYQGIVAQNYIAALGFFFACVFMSYAGSIISSFFSMGF